MRLILLKILILKYYIGNNLFSYAYLAAFMIELHQIVCFAKENEHSPLPLELKVDSTQTPAISLYGQVIQRPTIQTWGVLTASFFRRLLRLHTYEQKEAANLFIAAMYKAHTNTEVVKNILRSEKIRPHTAITSKQVVRAYQKFELLEQTSYEFVDDGRGKNHKELRFMHGLVLKLKSYFR